MTEEEQLTAVNQYGGVISYINSPTPDVVKAALTNQVFAYHQLSYEFVVEQLFADNIMLMKKWLRYGEVMRAIA